MAKHLRFNINTSFVDTLSEHGRFTAERLQLNEPVTVRFRSNTLANLVLCVKQLGHLNSEADAVSNAWKKGKLSDAVRSLELGDIDRQIREMASLIQDLQGLTPLPPLPKSRLGVPL